LFGAEVWINPDGLEWARAKWGRVAKLYFRLMEWSSLRVANRIIADAKAIELSLASRHGELKACSVIPYGCEIVEVPPPTEPLSKWNITPDEYYIVVCRLEPENHVREILEAFKSSQSERKLIVVGNSASGTKYVQGLLSIHDPRIQMIGTVYEKDRLIALRYHSFAYLHGHSVGGTNPSLLEAMGCGNFILAHDNPFNRETVATAGMFFRDAEGLTGLVNRVDADPSIRSDFKKKARVRARECFSWEDIVAEYAALMSQFHHAKHQ
jgi:glycosyltransferase involved in cell wall biosynthesis